MKPRRVVHPLLLVGLLLLFLLSMALSGSSSSSSSVAARPLPRAANSRGGKLLAVSTTRTDEMFATRDGEADDWSEARAEMEEEEEEWMEKRVTAEEAAQLDYIYTQRQSRP